MQCRNCGTEISDKALICYRCGEATTAPKIQPPPAPKRRGPIPVIVAMLLLIAAGFVVIPALPPGSERMAGWAAFVVAVFVAVWTLRPTPRSRRRRPRA
jgi:hypothetical protein